MLYVDRLQTVREHAARFGATVIAATKTQDVETISMLNAVAPEIEMGENRVQELLDKYDPSYVWHMIGRLQTNKAKYVVGKVKLIHSLDREELAKEIERQAAKAQIVQPCLVEINMGEEWKGGVDPEKAEEFVAGLERYPHIAVEGLMAVMPKADFQTLEPLYQNLERLFESTKRLTSKNLNVKYLSAGMSDDYMQALDHGANLLRIGRLLFGERE